MQPWTWTSARRSARRSSSSGAAYDEPEIYGGPAGDPGLAGGARQHLWEINGDLASVTAAGSSAIPSCEVLHPVGEWRGVSAAVDLPHRAAGSEPRTRSATCCAPPLGNTAGGQQRFVEKVKTIHGFVEGTRTWCAAHARRVQAGGGSVPRGRLLRHPGHHRRAGPPPARRWPTMPRLAGRLVISRRYRAQGPCGGSAVLTCRSSSAPTSQMVVTEGVQRSRRSGVLATVAASAAGQRRRPRRWGRRWPLRGRGGLRPCRPPARPRPRRRRSLRRTLAKAGRPSRRRPRLPGGLGEDDGVAAPRRRVDRRPAPPDVGLAAGQRRGASCSARQRRTQQNSHRRRAIDPGDPPPWSEAAEREDRPGRGQLNIAACRPWPRPPRRSARGRGRMLEVAWPSSRILDARPLMAPPATPRPSGALRRDLEDLDG